MISLILFICYIYLKCSRLASFIIKKGLVIYYKYKKLINYLIVGGLTTIINIVSYILFRKFLSSYIICIILSWIVSVLFAYITNRIFVFESKNKKLLIEFIKFIGCRLFTLGSEVLVMCLFVDWLKFNDMISKVIVQILIIILNYILSKIIVFT